MNLPPPGEYGVGMVFLPRGTRLAPGLRAGTRARDRRRGPGAAGWRDVPVDNDDADVAHRARQGRAGDPPVHRPRPDVIVPDALSASSTSSARRPRAIQNAEAPARPRSTTCRACRPHRHLQGHAARRPGRRVLHLDLQDPRVVSALALVHQRFSTNTFPSGRSRTRTGWSRTTARSTPSRQLQLDARARGREVAEVLGDDLKKLPDQPKPVDTASFDNALEFC